MVLFTIAILEAVVWNVPLVESASLSDENKDLMDYYRRESENLKSFRLHSNDVDPTIKDIPDDTYYEQAEFDRLKEYVQKHSGDIPEVISNTIGNIPRESFFDVKVRNDKFLWLLVNIS